MNYNYYYVSISYFLEIGENDVDPRCFPEECVPRGEHGCDHHTAPYTRCPSCVGVQGKCNGFRFSECPISSGALWCGNPDGSIWVEDTGE